MTWAERFAAFCERKTRQATGAELAPLRTEFDRADAGCERIGSAWTRRLFDGDFCVSAPAADRPAASLVFVQSREGNTIATDPSSLGGGPTDEHLIYEGLSRVSAGGVMAGAETLRGGNLVFSVWHPELVALRASLGLPRHPAQVVATLRGLDIEHGLIFNVPEVRVFIVSVGGGVDVMRDAIAERPWITTVPMPTPEDLPSAFRVLRAAGIGRVSVIGGRTVARALVRAGLVQDLYLTTSDRSGGQPGTPLFEGTPPHSVVVRKSGPGLTFEQWRFG